MFESSVPQVNCGIGADGAPKRKRKESELK